MVELISKSASYLTDMLCSIDVSEETREQVTITDVNLTESLLTPGLQTSITVHSKINNSFRRNLNDYYGKNIQVSVKREILKDTGHKSTFDTQQKIYRLSNRQRVNYEIESFQIDACDDTLIQDAKVWVSKSWKAVTPSTVVSDMFSQCLSPRNIEIEESTPPRDYIAENIHPFQVINQQAEVALTGAMDPSFVHFMTYQNSFGADIPTHNFKSLTAMAQQAPVFVFTYSGKASADLNYATPSDIMSYSFPCDFDLLSDVLNGYDETGSNIFSLITVNPYNATSSIYGLGFTRCGGTSASSITNLGTEAEQATSATNVEQYLLRRRPRMAMLDQDKIALRMTVPFNPNLSAGKVVTANFYHSSRDELLYGSGDYLIVNMTHNIKHGGLGMTILDCVSNTVATGRV